MDLGSGACRVSKAQSKFWLANTRDPSPGLAALGATWQHKETLQLRVGRGSLAEGTAPLLWNAFPFEVCLASSLLSFRKQVKMILFRGGFNLDEFEPGI